MRRTCLECLWEFVPSSGHQRCPRCRFRKAKDLCAGGQPKQLRSSTCAACHPVKMAENGHWKGGPTKHHAGYVMVRMLEHPRARRNGGYVFEHILVMEDMLGRRLFPDETVHHKNGVRDDNRPENLELWTRPQPSGIRVDDAVAWAQEILRRYGVA